eukprot:scaffold203_cov149-Skeletonema_menzelii.AAC.5
MGQQQNNNIGLPPEEQTSTSNIAFGLIGGSFVTIIALTTPFITMQLKSSLPYMSTPRQKVEKALTFLSKRNNEMIANSLQQRGIDTTIKSRNITKQLHFVDLGSGDGTAVLAASSLGWRATGIEMNPTLWLISSIRRLLSNNKKIRTNSELKIGDMFSASISQTSLRNANCTMIFGVAPLMPRIANLIERECQPGCWIMSYRFRVPLNSGNHGEEKNKKDQASVGGSGGIQASLIYDEEEMRIYELNRHHHTTEEGKSSNND